MNARGIFYGRAGFLGLLLVSLALLLGGCGGGDGGGVFTEDSLRVDLLLEKTSLPVNTAQAQLEPGSPYVSQIAIRITERDSGLPVAGSAVTVSFAGAQVGGLLSEAEFFSGGGTPQPSVSLTAGGNGDARVYFVAGTMGGDARIRVRGDRPAADGVSGATGAEATTTIRVVSTAGPVAALEFTGPYADAIRENRVRFNLGPGEVFDAQNGAYSRVISVTAMDASGNPVPTNTPIRFHLIDAPLIGYPADGAGRFAITGFGDPQEGGYQFDAPGGNFVARGARPGAGDRLVLDPHPDDSSFFHAGIRAIMDYPVGQPGRLIIRVDEEPFRIGPNLGAVVPYTIGRARAGSIQPLAFTDARGTASTLLTYPASNVGRTAILVAHTLDYSVSAVFNPGTAVYLSKGGPELVLDPTQLPANATSSPIQLCVRDVNGAPIRGARIEFSVAEPGGVDVRVDGRSVPVQLLSPESGCLTALVSVRNQQPGSGSVSITVRAIDDRLQTAEETITVAGVATGTLLRTSLVCPVLVAGDVGPVNGSATYLYVDAALIPLPGVRASLAETGNLEDLESSWSFSPGAGGAAGALLGQTGSDGQVRLDFVFQAEDGTGNLKVNVGDGENELDCPAAPAPAP